MAEQSKEGGLFGEKSHIKSGRDLHSFLKTQKYLKPEERERVKKQAEKYIHESSGMNKQEWEKKVLRPLEKGKEDNIQRHEASRLRKNA